MSSRLNKVLNKKIEAEKNATIKQTLLQEKFMAQAKKLAENNKDINVVTPMREEIKKTPIQKTKGVEKYKDSKEISKLKRTITDLKKQSYDRLIQKRELVKRIDELEHKLESKENEIVELNKKIKEQELEQESTRRYIDKLEDDNRQLRTKMHNQGTLLSNHKAACIRYKKNVKDLRIRLGDEPQVEAQPNPIVSIANYENKLQEKDREVNKLKNMILKLKMQDNDKCVDEGSIEEVGFLQTYNGSRYFVDTEGKRYPILIPPIGSICKVQMQENGTALVVKIYDSEEYYIERSLRKPMINVKRTKDVKPLLIFEKPYKVLIIGSQRKNLYLAKLKEVNLDVDWFDSFELGQTKLEEILHKYDIIICCKSHAKHYAVEVMKAMQKTCLYKYQILDNDTVTRILARVHYAVESIEYDERINKGSD